MFDRVVSHHIFHRVVPTLLAALLVCAGCGDDDGSIDVGPELDGGVDATLDATPDAPPDAGPSCTVSAWDPEGGELANWPDESLLVEDPSTGTGYRLVLDPGRYEETLGAIGGYLPIFTEDLSALDGFGNNAQAFFRFGRAFDVAALPSGDATASPTAGLGFVVLGEEPRLVPALVTATDEDATLMLAPLRPLPEQTWAVAFVTRAITDAAGGCLEPSAGFLARIAAPDARTRGALDALTTLGVIAAPDEVVAMSVFPVQSITDDTRAIAEHARSLEPRAVILPTCEDGALWRRCDGAFEAFDYRGADGVIRRAPGDPVAPTLTYDLPYTVWLPLEGEGPFPTIVWGSGLGSGRSQGERLADAAAPAGFATIAIDPVAHGEHPDVPEDAGEGVANAVFRFFEIGESLRERAMYPLRLRENFRQSTYDKLQLIRFVEGGLDLDDDGAADLDATRLSYLGVSLGGIMGVELLAASSDLTAGVLVVPGGRVGAMVSDSETIGPLVELLRPRGATPGDIRRFFPVLQTLLERGDAASYGGHVQHDRFAPGRGPHILAGVVLDDDTVPNIANYTLMRAMDLPLVATLLRVEPGIGSPLPAPVRGNLPVLGGGFLTGGFLQFDVVRDGGEVGMATHGNVGASETGIAAWLAFLESLDDEAPVIIDPYETTGLMHAM